MDAVLPELVLDAAEFDDIPGFYAAINRLFMAGEDWTIGPSLDAFDDMLHGGYGLLHRAPKLRLIWRGMAKSRADLGVRATRRWLEEKLHPPGAFDRSRILAQIAALEAGQGQTYFEILTEILAAHPNIDLVPG